MFLIFVYKTYKMKTIKLSVLILSSILLFNSCGNGLSRSKAEKLLNESFKYPACEVTEFNFNFWTQNRDEFKNTLETGLLEEQMVYRFGSASDTKEFFISEKGKQYIIGDNLNYKGSQFNVITNSMVLYKITGIVEDKQNKTAVVQFVIVVSLSNMMTVGVLVYYQNILKISGNQMVGNGSKFKTMK